MHHLVTIQSHYQQLNALISFHHIRSSYLYLEIHLSKFYPLVELLFHHWYFRTKSWLYF